MSHRIAGSLVSLGHHVETARGLRLDRAGDEALLLVAAQRGAILLTSNAKDFQLLHDAWQRWSSAWSVDRAHPGIVVFIQTWTRERAAREVDALLRSGIVLANELHDVETGGRLGASVTAPDLTRLTPPAWARAAATSLPTAPNAVQARC